LQIFFDNIDATFSLSVRNACKGYLSGDKTVKIVRFGLTSQAGAAAVSLHNN